MESRECINALLTRRSIRKFKPEDVPFDLILKALDIARRAPSARNWQPWDFVVVREKEQREKLSKIHPWAKYAAEAPVAIVVLADSQRAPDSYMIDGSLAAMYLWLALHCLGLGAVWLHTVPAADTVRQIINAPSHLYPIALFAVGYPDEQPPARPRKDLKEIVHLETYGNKLK
ncbi:MAG: nitroreductase family protein [Thermofilaceae archaeon]|nr:nitroreductase family protein [Thermofilaceae archaeon]MCX8179772.1 nitroreductase family protein [Thermofilaceae archaeon]MDW8004299.1 nitroreductase family protein [Thermofilaceae archaeon]